jgi:prepilin-type N-terminal cleavage/methylation domain-containing protein
MRVKGSFTMIELLIVMSIIAILAVAIIPNFIGFDKEAKVAATKSNLDTLRSRVTLFRAKQSRYPTSLTELLTTTYLDAGVSKPYLNKIPSEMVSAKSGSNVHVAQYSTDPLSGRGGWAYLIDKAEVIVNFITPLEKSWGEYEGQIPKDW